MHIGAGGFVIAPDRGQLESRRAGAAGRAWRRPPSGHFRAGETHGGPDLDLMARRWHGHSRRTSPSRPSHAAAIRRALSPG
jgi:hypothetical protein